LQAAVAEAEIMLDGRQRDVHDRDVQADHALGGAGERQHQPALDRLVRGRVGGGQDLGIGVELCHRTSLLPRDWSAPGVRVCWGYDATTEDGAWSGSSLSTSRRRAHAVTRRTGWPLTRGGHSGTVGASGRADSTWSAVALPAIVIALKSNIGVSFCGGAHDNPVL
jgi:hypothetical protein